MPQPYSGEFRHGGVRVARNRGLEVTLHHVAADHGAPERTLSRLRRVQSDEGSTPGATAQEHAELRQARRPRPAAVMIRSTA